MVTKMLKSVFAENLKGEGPSQAKHSGFSMYKCILHAINMILNHTNPNFWSGCHGNSIINLASIIHPIN